MFFIKIIVPLSNYLSFTDNVLTFMVNEDLYIEKKVKNTKMLQYWKIKLEKRNYYD